MKRTLIIAAFAAAGVFAFAPVSNAQHGPGSAIWASILVTGKSF